MRREVLRTIGSEFCILIIELTRDPQTDRWRLSICGTAGDIVPARTARKMALDRTTEYFEDNPDEIKRVMGQEEIKRVMGPRARARSAVRAARVALSYDGEYAGLDAVREVGNKVYLGHSFGQIREELARFFPEVVPYFAWHMNDLHAACEHQDARGEDWKSHPGTVCPDCGWKWGNGWHYRALPADVIRWAETFGADNE